MNATLLAGVVALRDKRDAHAALAAAMREERAKFEAEHADLIKRLADANLELQAADAEVRSLAETIYAETKDPRPALGVTVKVWRVLRYDPVKALEWATFNASVAITRTIDPKVFDKLIDAMPEQARPPFVTVEERAKVTLALDLHKALSVIEEPTDAPATTDAPTEGAGV